MNVHCFSGDLNVAPSISFKYQYQLVLQGHKSRLSFEGVSQPSRFNRQPM